MRKKIITLICFIAFFIVVGGIAYTGAHDYFPESSSEKSVSSSIFSSFSSSKFSSDGVNIDSSEENSSEENSSESSDENSSEENSSESSDENSSEESSSESSDENSSEESSSESSDENSGEESSSESSSEENLGEEGLIEEEPAVDESSAESSGEFGEESGDESSVEEIIEHVHNFLLDSFKDSTCTNYGIVVFKCECGDKTFREISPKGHDYYLSSGEYIYTAKCSRCGYLKRNGKINDFNNLLRKTTEHEKLVSKIGENYSKLEEMLSPDADKSYKEFAVVYDEFIKLSIKAEDNYRIYYSLSTADSKTYGVACNSAQSLRDDCLLKGYSLLIKIRKSRFYDDFYSSKNGWSEQSIQSALYEADLKIAEMNLSYELSDNINGLYYNLVQANKELAAIFGYNGDGNDGFIEYAYKLRYGRDYSPYDTSEIKSAIKTYVVPLYINLYNNRNELMSDFSASIYKSELGGKMFSNYLKFLDKKTGGCYYETVNAAFKNGNVIKGEDGGSFTLKFSDGGVIRLGSGSDDAFSLAHEVGHYLCSDGAVYGVPLDYAETAAVFNEVLFLSYITSDQNTLLTAKQKDAIKNEKLLNLTEMIIAAAAIDDFETAVYSNYYFDDNFLDGISLGDYDLLFNCILSDYNVSGYLSSDYWKNVAEGDSCYYFSYAVSSLIALNEYADIVKNGFEHSTADFSDLLSATEFCVTDNIENGSAFCAEYFNYGHFGKISFSSFLGDTCGNVLSNKNYYESLSALYN